MASSPASRQISRGLAWLGLALSWAVPGLGFLLVGRRRRGTAFFVIICSTFALGLVLHSSVSWPSWSIQSEDFNLINNFTFIVQMMAGAPAVASFLASLAPGQGGGLIGWLGGIPSHPWYELGSYYLIVAGAMNYFAIGNYYDRIVHVKERFSVQESADEVER